MLNDNRQQVFIMSCILGMKSANYVCLLFTCIQSTCLMHKDRFFLFTESISFQKFRFSWIPKLSAHNQQWYHNTFLLLLQPFYIPLLGTTRVSWYQKKHSPTHTYPDRQSCFISFLHLMCHKTINISYIHTRYTMYMTTLD